MPETFDTSSPPGRKKAVLIDRDGTLIADIPYLHDPEAVALLPTSAAALRRFRAAGYALVVVTNQSGVGRGYFPLAAMHAVHERLRDMLAAEGVRLDAIYYCPHAPDAGCACRKPATGMAERAARELDLDLGESIMIGDTESDILLGRRIGATTVLMSGGGTPAIDADHVVASLAEAVERLEIEGATSPR